MNLDLSNKKVIITGGSTGIGKEVVTLFATNGAKVAIFDINEERGLQIVRMFATCLYKDFLHAERFLKSIRFFLNNTGWFVTSFVI